VPTIGLPDTADASIFPAAKVQTIPELIATKALAQGVNPTLAASITQGLPASSLQGRIDTTLLNLTLASRPTPKLRSGPAGGAS